MSELNISAATTTNLSAAVPDFIVKAKALDIASPNSEESYYYFSEATQHLGYYFGLGEIFNAANAVATWAYSRGYTIVDRADNPVVGSEMEQQLRHVRGMGKDTFSKLIWQHGVVKLICGDSFLEVKKEGNKIVNMIPYSPERVRLVFEKDGGMLKRYDVWNGEKWKPIKIENMLHSSNKRIGDQVHGTSQITPSKKNIDAINEALDDERIIKHRDKALGIVYYKTDKAGKIEYANQQIERAVEKGEMVGLPENTAKIEPYPSRSSEDRTAWIQYNENRFYQNFGVPRSIASSDGTSEVGGKMGHVIFEPIYTKEQIDMEDDLWTQQQISIKFNRPPILGGLQQDESKNTTQNIQPNDTAVTLNRE